MLRRCAVVFATACVLEFACDKCTRSEGVSVDPALKAARDNRLRQLNPLDEVFSAKPGCVARQPLKQYEPAASAILAEQGPRRGRRESRSPTGSCRSTTTGAGRCAFPAPLSQAELGNHSTNKNPEHMQYWMSRGATREEAKPKAAAVAAVAAVAAAAAASAARASPAKHQTAWASAVRF